MTAPAFASELLLVVDDDTDHATLLRRWLEADGYAVETPDSGVACLAALSRILPSAVLLDLHMPGLSGLETLTRIRALHPRLPVIIVTGDEEVESVVAAMRLGAYDYLVKPITRTKLTAEVRNAVERGQMSLRLAQFEREAAGAGYAGIVGVSPPMRHLFRQLDRVAPTDVTVLIHGESGSGKELVARAIHANSGRHDAPFVAVNCAAIPEGLQESQLFGHERGAFTGATARHRGVFERAHRGTLFLDEIGELSLVVQPKLLRVLQERVFQRLGGTGDLASDFRLIVATHRDLAAEVRAGRFRQDLFFRLAVLELRVPPLRERPEDLPLLAERFLAEAGRGGSGLLRLSPEAVEVLGAYDWPGNVRELQNAIQHTAVLATGGVVEPADLPSRLRAAVSADSRPAPEPSATARPDTRPLRLAEVERRAIEEALARSAGNVSEVGRALGIGRTTLYRKLREYGLHERSCPPHPTARAPRAGDPG